MHRHVTRLLVGFALVAGGCGGSAPAAMVACGPPECAADSTLLLVAEVDPSSDSGLPRQEFGSVTIDAQTGLFALALSPQVTLAGVVKVSQGAGTVAKPIAATVTATRPSRITGRPDVSYQAVVSPTDGSYRVIVSQSLPGEKYSLRVSPTDPSLAPPRTLTVVAGSDQVIDVTFEAPLTLPEIHGTVLNSLQQPVAGMQVQATTVAEPDGSPSVVSTTTTTDASGAFSIRLVASPPDNVMLTATPTNASPGPLPTLARLVDTTKLGPTASLTAGLTLPPLPAPVEVSYSLIGVITSSGAQMPVTSATCTFTADVSDPHATDGTTATYQTSATADAITGQVTLDLIPAESANRIYQVVVTPDPSQLFATTPTTVAVAPGGLGPSYGPDIVLRPRAQLSGRILGADGKPLAGVMVVPADSTVAAALAATPSSSSATPQQTTASNEGRFSLRLDPGFWDVGLVPPADALLPRLWLQQKDLRADLDVGTVVMPAGVLVHGVVHDPSGAPLPHASVRIYTAESGNDGCPPNTPQCLTPPRLRAESTSGSDGIVAVILPSQPQ